MQINKISIISQIQKYFTKLNKAAQKNKSHILYKYIPTSIMLALSAYIYSLLRGVKDSILVPSLGAELISFVKFYGVFPSTIIFFICFSKLVNILSRDKLYYCIATFFIGFFLLYAFVLGPYTDFFHPDLSSWMISLPKFMYYPIIMLQNWTVSLFYVMSELCGTVLLTFLFWQFANDLYNIKEAKRTYVLFAMVGQLGLITAGLVQNNISVHFIDSSSQGTSWNTTIQWMMLSIALVGFLLMLLYRWIYKNVLLNPELCDRKHHVETEKVSLSVIESFKYVFSSRYLWLIMVIVFCYGLGINMIESVWKDRLRMQYPSQNSYSAFMGTFHIYFGMFTMCIMLCGVYVVRSFKWIVSALCTPVVAGLTGAIFFAVIIFQDLFKPILDSLDMSILYMAVMLGSLQVMIFKAFNYAFVDATKEMAFIPLNRELRTKGKAAVDVIGGRFGKAFGAVLQQLMFQFISPNISDLTYEICIVFVVVMCMWMYSVRALNKEFLKVTGKCIKDL
jgi:ATP:ADP antiporter, AAA family